MTPSQTHLDQTVPADASPINRSDLRWLLKLLFMAFAELERMFPGRSFMPRGEAADALAECVAKAHYDLSGFPDQGRAGREDLPAGMPEASTRPSAVLRWDL